MSKIENSWFQGSSAENQLSQSSISTDQGRRLFLLEQLALDCDFPSPESDNEEGDDLDSISPGEELKFKDSFSRFCGLIAIEDASKRLDISFDDS